MPPACPHAVWSIEESLTVGGQFYLSSNLGSSLEGLRLQERHPDISNENIHTTTYAILANILHSCDSILTCTEKAKVLSNCELFLLPPVSPSLSGETDEAATPRESKPATSKPLGTRGRAAKPRATKSATSKAREALILAMCEFQQSCKRQNWTSQ